jgi:hypothetical protein
MPSGPHLAGGLGASERPGTLATSQRTDSHANPNTGSDSYAKTNTHADAQADTYSGARSRLFRHLECFAGLHRRHDRQFEWHQLHSRVLDAKPESGNQ